MTNIYKEQHIVFGNMFVSNVRSGQASFKGFNVNPSLVNNEPIFEPFEMYVFKKAKCYVQN